MLQSKRFRALEKRLREARRHFLPKSFSSTGAYSARQVDLTRAYRVLVHAEIEAFIEDIARAAIISNVNRWKQHRRPSATLMAFLACYHAGWSESSEDPKALPEASQKVRNDPDDVINHALKQYHGKLKENHGVRESDLRTLIPPTGVRWADLDSTWIASLDAYGTQRGIVAHSAVTVQQTIDPKSELDSVTAILAGLAKLDALLLNVSS